MACAAWGTWKARKSYFFAVILLTFGVINVHCVAAPCEPAEQLGGLVGRVAEADETKERLAAQIAGAVREERYLLWQLKKLDEHARHHEAKRPPTSSVLFVVSSQKSVEIDSLLHALESANYEVHTARELELNVLDTTSAEQETQAETYLEMLLEETICFDCTTLTPVVLVIGVKEALILSRMEVFMEVLRPRIIYVSRRNVAKVCVHLFMSTHTDGVLTCY
jgi:hypothetical protein